MSLFAVPSFEFSCTKMEREKKKNFFTPYFMISWILILRVGAQIFYFFSAVKADVDVHKHFEPQRS